MNRRLRYLMSLCLAFAIRTPGQTTTYTTDKGGNPLIPTTPSKLPNSLPAVAIDSGVLGDLRITLTAAREASDEDLQQYKIHPKSGYHFVLVFFKVKNVAHYSSCGLFQYWLGVRQGYQYKGVPLPGMDDPRVFRLPPAEESDGGVRFEIKDGTQPATLKILRDKLLDDVCAQSQHRDAAISGPVTVRFSLQSLLANTH